MGRIKKKHLTGSKLRYYNFIHTQQRAKQRYNLILNRSNYEQLCQEIKQKKFVQLSHTYKKKHQDVYKVKFKNTTLYVLYKIKGGRITTALPFQRFERIRKAS